MRALRAAAQWWRGLPRRAHAAALAVGTVAVTVATLWPSVPPPPSPWLDWDKAAHIGLWGILAWLSYPLFGRVGPPLALAVAHGGLIELLQVPVPGRSGDVLDWIADAIGAVVAVAVAHRLWRLGASPSQSGIGVPPSGDDR